MVFASSSHCRRELESNKLTGTIPSSICPLVATSISYCHLNNNDFSCPLPCDTAKICGDPMGNPLSCK